MRKKIKIPLIIAFISLTIFVADIATASLWKRGPIVGWLIYRIFPCSQYSQSLMDAPPCFVKYDFIIMPFVLGIFIFSSVITLGLLVYNKFSKK